MNKTKNITYLQMEVRKIYETYLGIIGHEENNSRKQEFVMGRAAFAAAFHGSLSLHSLGEVMGNNHATIVHHHKNHESNLQLESYGRFFQVANELRTKHDEDNLYDTDLPALAPIQEKNTGTRKDRQLEAARKLVRNLSQYKTKYYEVNDQRIANRKKVDKLTEKLESLTEKYNEASGDIKYYQVENRELLDALKAAKEEVKSLKKETYVKNSRKRMGGDFVD